MPNVTTRYTLPTLQLSDLLRRVLRRVDDWTLIAFNPHYPSPADNR